MNETVALILQVIVLGTFSVYLLMMCLFSLSWLSYPLNSIPQQRPGIKVTVIIPARNEAASLSHCLSSLESQDFPKELLEIIVVDDASEDGTAELAEAYGNRHEGFPVKVIRMKDDPATRAHKKRAITLAMREAAGDLIITTDADCEASPYWIRGMAAFYEKENPALILGPVVFHREKGIFGKMQGLEFTGLCGITGASAGLNLALMCNGANLGYSRKVFEEVGGYEGDSEASGDDMMLLMKVKKKYPGKIRFLKSKMVIVKTLAQENLESFLNQRKRWASKFRTYGAGIISATAVLVFFVNLFFLGGWGLGLLIPGFMKVYLILGAGKLIIEFLFLFLAASFSDKRGLLWLFIPEQIVYSCYVVLAGLLGLKGNYTWKGRKIDQKAGKA